MIPIRKTLRNTQYGIKLLPSEARRPQLSFLHPTYHCGSLPLRRAKPLELPKEDEIKAMALENLPEDYVLKRVQLTYGPAMPEDPSKFIKFMGGPPPKGFHNLNFEVTIEYEYQGDEVLRGTSVEIDTFQSWAEPLKEKIRDKWPPEALRICFSDVTDIAGKDIS